MINNKTCSLFFLLGLLVPLAGCSTFEHRPPDESPHVFTIETLAVFGFLSAPLSAEEGNTVRSPLTGSVFIRGPVPPEIPEQLTARLFDSLAGRLSVELISPDIARRAFLTVRDSSYSAEDREILRKTGESLLVDTLLAGYVFRWQERSGTDFSISRAASVAFELALLRVADGSLIWKGRFDKTQASLAENLLDLKTFLRGKGRWMNVEDLAGIGLSELVEQLPVGEKD
jgi:hypothetical protein